VIEFDNASLEPEREFVDEVGRAVFTTGALFDEAPPAFSGLQSLRMTQHPAAVEECCLATEEFCEGQCGSPCDWCWPVDYLYGPVAELTFGVVDDEFGPQNISYTVHRLEDEFSEPGRPLEVLRYTESGTETHRLLLTPGDEGPYCFVVQAHDAFGRVSDNTPVVCKSAEDIEPIEALEVPEPDRSFCLEGDTLDAGMGDGGDNDVGVDSDLGSEDEGGGVVPDLPEENEEAPQVVTVPRDGGDNCGCHTPTRPSGGAHWALLLVGCLALGRRGARKTG
jgi:hypothetical protein